MENDSKKAKPASLKIDWATHEAALYACQNWHYSKCIPKSKLVKLGVWENDKFVGVVIFGLGATQNLGKPYGLNMQECCELVRIALRKHMTPVSRIMSIAIRFLKKSNPGLKLIISFADRTQGHHGGIYQATNWIYSGQTESAEFFRDPKGKLWHPRRASRKVCAGKQLVTDKWTVEMQQPKYRYLMPLDEQTRKRVQSLAKPYPKRAVSKAIVATEFHSVESGETPTTALQSS